MSAEQIEEIKQIHLIQDTEDSSSAQNRRLETRFDTDASARVLLVLQSSEMVGRIENLSLGGCCLETMAKCAPGPGSIVEITFTINRLSLRLGGTVQWSDGWRQMGVRFAHMSARRKDDLKMLICELQAAEAEVADKAQAAARAKAAAREEAEAAAAALAAQVADAEESSDLQNATAPDSRDRRTQKRHEINNKAIIYPVRSGGQIECLILDLSLGGCRLRTLEKSPFNIYTRIEVGFQAEGLPFRISGVVQNTKELQLVGIRFLDVGERSRERLQVLMRELEEKRELL
ncbi:PilZ domain-containing protein [Telmatobacter bradus]|uniref:PilZ domain-containing protein n=1 Tax=Telmatobacter bradus TaxID=474953 RepID=UPI003B42C238